MLRQPLPDGRGSVSRPSRGLEVDGTLAEVKGAGKWKVHVIFGTDQKPRPSITLSPGASPAIRTERAEGTFPRANVQFARRSRHIENCVPPTHSGLTRRTSAENYRARAGANPAPHTGFVTAIRSKFETMALPRGAAFFTAGKDRDASWLAMLSHTSVTQIEFSSAASLATT